MVAYLGWINMQYLCNLMKMLWMAKKLQENKDYKMIRKRHDIINQICAFALYHVN